MRAPKSFATLDTTVRVVVIAIGILAGIGIPGTYGFVAYNGAFTQLSYRSEFAARRVAEYAYIQGDTWRFSSHRVAELIAFYRVGEHQVVTDSRGGTVVDVGQPIAGPRFRVVSPITVRGRQVGALAAEAGLSGLYAKVGLLAILGFCLGAAVLACAHFIPLRALRRAIADHQSVERALNVQIEQTQSALIQAQEAAQAKSLFLATMSHEIRTPMNAVIGLSTSLLESTLDSEQRHLVDTISESGHSLLRLLNDILEVSKLDARKVEFENLPFSPAALLDHTISIVETKALEKGLTIRALADTGLPAALSGDHARLAQVLLNLADNAIKFTEAGTIEIGGRCLGQTADRATIEYTVRDTGIGIASDQIGNLFSEFTQADPSISRKYGGTGLGLAISKRIIEQMGGTISAASVLGEWTSVSFTVTLPKADVAALTDTSSRHGDSDLAAILARLDRPLRVLLAEDSATNQLVFSRLVRSFGFELTIAQNGREALDLARAQSFDIVFMDMRMPDMDGLQATRAIRELGGPWSAIPIVAVTANAFADDVQACRDAGMDDFIAKPIRKTLLLESLSAALRDHPLIRAAASAPGEAPSPGEAAQTPPGAAPPQGGLSDPRPVLDRATLAELTEAIGADGVRATLDVFIAETVIRLDLMRRLSCHDDRGRIKLEAHTLKGASGTLGFCRLSDLARTLEHGAPSIAPADYADLVDRLDACFQAARQDIALVLAGVPVAA